METKERHHRELLRRWISGDIDAQGEAELLAAADRDVLLREALAAYRAAPEHDHAAALARLRTHAQGATGSGRVRTLSRWAAVAASVLVLTVAAWWVVDRSVAEDGYSSAPEEKTTTQAPVSAPPPAVVEAAPAAEPLAQAPSASSPAPQVARSAPMEPPIVTPPSGTPSEKLIAEAESDLALKDDASRKDYPDTAATEVLAERAEETAEEDVVFAAPAAPPTEYARKRTYDVSNSGAPLAASGYRLVEGYVRDQEGYPLIGATVREPGTANGTVTDIDGFFRLSVAEATEQLSVSYTGFETSDILLDLQDGDLEIALNENSANLDEVVVSGYGQTRTPAPSTARPSDGFRRLRKYIADNTPANTPRADVRLRFQVQADGRLTNFEVLSGADDARNDLAVELLRNGPRWEIISGSAPVEVVYVIRFR